jgi:hypothetical protein
MSRVRRIALLVGVTTLVLAAPASASVTIGSSLSSAPDPVGGICTDVSMTSCTVAVATLEPARTAAGLTVPAGVVVKWRVRTRAGATSFKARPRVLGANTGMAAGDTVTVQAVDGEQAFPTRLPVAAGQRVGIDILEQPALATASIINSGVAAGSFDLWQPSLGVPESRSPDMTPPNSELLINADVELDADGDGYGDETQDACPDVPDRHVAPCHDPPPPTGDSGTLGTGSTSGGTGGSTAGGGTTLGGALPNGPPVVTAPPPLPTPKTKKKAKRCKRAKAKQRHRAKRCPKKRRPSHRR